MHSWLAGSLLRIAFVAVVFVIIVVLLVLFVVFFVRLFSKDDTGSYSAITVEEFWTYSAHA